jgi:AAA domain/UvrD-like helicase C-terminal domain
LFSHTAVYQAKGLYITPFKAQAKEIASYFAREHLHDWAAGTVHAQQGTEADVVIFDTVNAGSTGWPYDEWKRLVNVGLSRAREFLIVLASRAEMNEPYLRPLLDTLAPRVLKRAGRQMGWIEVSVLTPYNVPPEIASNPSLLGNQLSQRKMLRPLMSKEQQQLCAREMDGKPRLVRGVAGSGKTLVLAHWLQKTVQRLLDKPDAKVWAVFANKSLQRLIADTIEEAWKIDQPSSQFPWHRVELMRVDTDILGKLLPEVGLNVTGFDYDQMAASYLEKKPFEQIKPCCQAMFIDEAQDMGPNLIKLLSALVERTDPEDSNSRAVNIFYDNAQNIYGRSTPKWKELGLEIQGQRSKVMKESFRSTRPIAEFALNVLYRLQPPEADPDHKELVKQGLIERTQRGPQAWWIVRFNQVEGPTPIFKKYPSLDRQVDAVTEQVVRWIREDNVKPGDICILCNDKHFREQIRESLAPRLHDVQANIISEPGTGWNRDDRSVVASTVHSFKGYDSEIVIVAGLERFFGRGQILANNLYVAMTRARSILAVYAYARQNPNAQTTQLLTTFQDCLDELVQRPKVEREISNLEEFVEVLERLGAKNDAENRDYRDWLEKIWKSHSIQQEPIKANDGEILAEPLFWFQDDDRLFACFGKDRPRAYTLHKLEDNNIEVILPTKYS